MNEVCALPGATQVTETDELDLHKRYLKALGIVAGLLLEETSEQNLTELLRLLNETTCVSRSALFLNKNEDNTPASAKLQCTWSSAEDASSLADFSQFREIIYQDYPLLSDTLLVGMVFSKNLSELPREEAALFARHQIHTVLCIPLLVQGEMEGFIGLFCQRSRSWQAVEINVLCAVANSLALALARKRAEVNLEVTTGRLKALVGATEDMVIEFDNKGQILNT